MAKITISSTRIYYQELDQFDALSIKTDIGVYQSMRKKAYKELYENFAYGKDTVVNPKYLKAIYHTNDYFPLSAIAESKSLLKSQKTWHVKTLKNKRNKVKKINKKIKMEEKELDKYLKTLASLIAYSKAKKNNEVVSVVLCPNLWCDNGDECVYISLKSNILNQ